MATNITIEQAYGTELVIPEAGTERRGEINITANNGFFNAVTTDGEKQVFLKKYDLNTLGATVKGMEQPSQGKFALFTEDDADGFKNNNDLFSFYTAINTVDGRADDWKECTYDFSTSRILENIDANDSKIDLTNVYGQAFNGMKMLPSLGGDKRVNTSSWSNWYQWERKTIVNLYIENNDIYSDMILINFYNNVRIMRDKVQYYNGSEWLDIPLSNQLPYQQWFQVEIDYSSFSYYGVGQKPVYLKVNGEEIDIASQSVAAGLNYYIFFAYGRSEKTMDYVKYSTLAQIPTGRIEEIRGIEARDEVITITKNLITPV